MAALAGPATRTGRRSGGRGTPAPTRADHREPHPARDRKCRDTRRARANEAKGSIRIFCRVLELPQNQQMLAAASAAASRCFGKSGNNVCRCFVD